MLGGVSFKKVNWEKSLKKKGEKDDKSISLLPYIHLTASLEIYPHATANTDLYR